MLVTEKLNDAGRERIRTLVESNDGFYIADMDIGGFFWNLYAGKWWGFFWGYGRTQSWVSARQGCVSAPINRTLNVGFNLASITDSTQAGASIDCCS